MRILMVCEYYWPNIGGVEVVFQNIAERLAALGHKVDVVTARVHGSQKLEVLNGVSIHRVYVPKFADRYFFGVMAITTVLRLARQCDIIHTTQITAAIPSWFARKILKRKTIVTIHEVFGERFGDMFGLKYFRAFIFRKIEEFLLKLNFDYYVMVSDNTKKEFLKLRPEVKNKTTRIYNGVDVGRLDIKNINPHQVRKSLGLHDQFLYLYYGRPGISKGVGYLVEAVSLIKNHIPKSRLLLVLSKKPISNYKAICDLIEKQNLQKDIKLFGSLSGKKLSELMAICDCVVIPSLSEGFGFTTAECSTLSIPIVATRVGSLPEIAYGKVVFVEPKNAAALAEGVFKIYKGDYQKVAPKNFSWGKAVEEYLKIYKREC